MKRIWTILAASALAAPAAANDSTAEHAAGGLVLTRSAEIDMVSEDLFVSADEVRVRYVFRNRSPRDIRTVVAFPMPDRDLAEEWDMDVAYPSGFETRVGGRPVKMEVDRRAVQGGVDYSHLLASKGVLPTSDGEALNRLSAGDRAGLIKRGLVQADEGHLMPAWTVRESWYWQQVFPAGRDVVVEHSYAPGTGGSVDSALSLPGFRATPEGRAMIRDYCVDSAFLAGLDRLRRRGGGAPERRVGYILTTGGNWRSPIGSFRLAVDKGAPGNLVSFCGEGVRKTSPTRFEMLKRNWRPDRDLKVLIVSPGSSSP
jgi:Domain of unknown function (DUF4424)